MIDTSDRPAATFSDGIEARVPDPTALGMWAEKYEAWTALVSDKRPIGHETIPTRAEPLNWTPLRVPLSECRVALVTTGGVHLKAQKPFDVFDAEGDWTSRTIPGDVDTADLSVTHTHYDRTDALQDINVMFPLDRLRELAGEGWIGDVSPIHFGLMGFLPDPKRLLSDSGPAIAESLKSHEVDIALLTPG